MTQDGKTYIFTNELLYASSDERKTYFKNLFIQHPKLNNALNEVTKKILTNRTPIVLLFGPSGVGKSTLLKKLLENITTMNQQEMEINKGFIPAIYVEAKATDKFNWGDYFRSALIALYEPLIEHKIVPSQLGAFEITSSSRKTHSALRWSYELALQHRKTLAVIVDEAQHFARVARGSKLQDQMDVIKSLANITRTPHILAGTYENLVFRNLSAQLSNRSEDVHLSRYRYEVVKEREAFAHVFRTFIDHLPVQKKDDLIHQWKFIYERSLGLVGVLKKWFEMALNECIDEPNNLGTEITGKHFENTAYSVKQCEIMMDEIERGEGLLYDALDDRVKLLKRLNLEKSNTEQSTTKEALKSTGRKPYQRKKKRDKVGI
ncbi:TniB family NTP-binding protein [Paenibacillus oryzisoli]|uniref:AAA+ ATPase domain-containing protein n=1 Tax=Paenibacillus oryzisoli TaxID=1850517 RepID=A0A197ZY87_9BACL|nr:TniB family NTP-binding protein [Paenibacillus oryzisoli]OAS13751.1 hypothetical protein A8708_25255 [Paenibacillus oryzisoli]